MMDTLSFTLAISLAICAIGVTADYSSSETSGSNPCFSKLKCHECIRTSTCAWCAQPNFSENRCFRPNQNPKILEACSEEFTINPDNVFSMIRYKNLTKGGFISGSGGSMSGGSMLESSSFGHSSSSSNSSLSSSKVFGSSKQEAVQLWPQEVNLKLRINEAYRMTFSYSQAEDYPVDLYYLMDLSKSMEDDQKKLSALGQLLVSEMSKITSNFRLGFGSFVDKVVMPYVNTMPKSLIAPCKDCAAPYGYRNVMTLSTDTSAFASLVSNAEVSGNLDAPEGGFDAIMQAIVCRGEIGWREKARRLLVFSTDAGFHYAGDGKLGGIIKPNDGECHLDRTGLYTHSSLQDYPSISQINLKVKQNAINIIWAVTEEQIGIYKRLTKHVEGSFAGKLLNDSSNIVELIREQYDKISSSVEMKDTASSMIKVKYYSKCLGGPEIETSKCDGLKVGNVVHFTAVIEVVACPANKTQWKQTFEIYPVGINETLTVNLEMICDCECEHSGAMYQPRSSACNGRGTLACGICDCDDGVFGNACQCSKHDNTPHYVNETNACRPDDSKPDCSGRGDCECGQCICHRRGDSGEVFSGRYCECDNFSCERNKGILCSGHGRCECGNCACDPGWEGDSCSCKTSKETCMAPNSGKYCSDHGDCICGECKCHQEGDIRYSGKYCNKCPSCASLCEELRPCVQCVVHETGNMTKDECYTVCNVTKGYKNIYGVETVQIDIDKDEEACMFIDEQDCKNHFKYYYNEENCLIIEAQKERECPPTIFVPGIILGVIAAIVLIGLAFLLLWKMVTTIHDRREFAKFEKERMMAKWDTGENPIYKQATSTFKNPTYAGK